MFYRLAQIKQNVQEATEALARCSDQALSAEERAIAADEFLDKEDSYVKEIEKEIRRLREQQVRAFLGYLDGEKFIMSP